MITRIEDLIALYTSVYYLEDTSVVPLIVASIISNRFPGDAFWLMLIGASSSGKSELINAVTDLEIEGKKKVWQISSLTENTFLSGATKGGKDISLLTKLGRNGVIVMKDFTTQLSQNQERAQAIFAQLREIYDGYYTKETGLGHSLSWKGKLNFIGGVTEKIFVMEKKYGGMGTRAVNYIMPPASRKEMTRRAITNNNNIEELRMRIRAGFSEYVNFLVERMKTYTIPEVPEEHNVGIIEVADFASLCRSATERDYKGTLELTQSPEMPSRMAKQMIAATNAFMLMNNGVLPEEYRKIVYRLGFDSIPIGRRKALRELARFQTVTTSGVAMALNYPTTTAREWLEDLNVFGVCDRVKGSGIVSSDKWRIKDAYRDMMVRYEGISVTTESLFESSAFGVYSDEIDPTMDDIDPGLIQERNEQLNQQFESI